MATRSSTKLPETPQKGHFSKDELDIMTTMSDEESRQEQMDEGDLYEQERLENIKANAVLLAGLGLSAIPSIRPPARSSQLKPPGPSSAFSGGRSTRSRLSDASVAPQPRRQKRPLVPPEPTRRSSRVRKQPPSSSTAGELNYLGLPASPPLSGDEGAGGRRARGRSPPSVRYEPVPKGRAVVVPDAETGEPARGKVGRPTRGPDGRLVFEGRWKGVFTPNLTPEEMFRGGAFGGGYFANTYSSILRAPLASSSVIRTLPFSFSRSDEAERLINPDPDGAINRFGVRAGQSLQEWEKAGWIWAEDPRGWAEWYIRFWDGRRCEDDERQVKRWLKVAGSTGRFKRALLKKIQQHGGAMAGAVTDETVSPILRQCLWQWGYELNEEEFERAMRGDD